MDTDRAHQLRGDLRVGPADRLLHKPSQHDVAGARPWAACVAAARSRSPLVSGRVVCRSGDRCVLTGIDLGALCVHRRGGGAGSCRRGGDATLDGWHHRTRCARVHGGRAGLEHRDTVAEVPGAARRPHRSRHPRSCGRGPRRARRCPDRVECLGLRLVLHALPQLRGGRAVLRCSGRDRNHRGADAGHPATRNRRVCVLGTGGGDPALSARVPCSAAIDDRRHAGDDLCVS